MLLKGCILLIRKRALKELKKDNIYLIFTTKIIKKRYKIMSKARSTKKNMREVNLVIPIHIHEILKSLKD